MIDIAGEPLAMAGRMLADMGAQVLKLEPAAGDPLRRAEPCHPRSGESLQFHAFNAGKSSLVYQANNDRHARLLRQADVVLATPGFPEVLPIKPSQAPQAIWLVATPFGPTGPRAHWQASDLGLMAASGNMHATGNPDRPPLRCSEPAGYAHTSAEACFAVLSALAVGGPQTIDLSMQETIMIANMGGAGQFPKTGRKGQRQGAQLGGTREIWPCRDGHVSFGLRGGPARANNYQILLHELEREGLSTPAWRDRDWPAFNPQTLEDTELRAIEEPLLAYFARYRMRELYQLAVRTNLMLAPANGARDVLDSEQLSDRAMFAPVGDFPKFPARFYRSRGSDNKEHPAAPPTPAPPLYNGETPDWDSGQGWRTAQASASCGAWQGLKLLEFGAGAAGPIATRYFVEHGATVIKIESTQRPDFLRVMARGSAHGLEGSHLFDALNFGKKSITLNLKDDRGKAIAVALFHWADAVIENFAPKAMRGWGLDYAAMVQHKPDLIMLSTCLNGQTGPHRDYPGFGGQGAALCGFNHLTGWPDSEPLGPFGTITDSLSPRFSASALAAAILYRRQTGEGVYLDISQVETGVYSLAPWLLHYQTFSKDPGRVGNASLRAAPHGAFTCVGDDRWIAIACWSDNQWQKLAALADLDLPDWRTLQGRLRDRHALEAAVDAWTASRDAQALAERLQDLGIEAVPVASFEDLFHHDPQLAERRHFVHLQRAQTGQAIYERNGFRLSGRASGIPTASPLLGEHTRSVLSECLNMENETIDQLQADGVLD